MVTKAQKIRLGVFLSVGFAVLLLMFGLVLGSKFITKEDVYYISFTDTSVNGLQVGGQVKYHGILIGTVNDIAIDPKDISKVVVTLRVKAGTPIKNDVRATLALVGITGLKSVELTGGSNAAKLLKPGSYIEPGATMFDSISGKAEIIAEKLETVLNNVALITGEENRTYVTGILRNTDGLIADNRDKVGHVVTTADSMMAYIRDLSRESNQAMRKLNAILDSKEMKAILSNTADFSGDLTEVDKVIADLSAISQRADVLLKHTDEVVKRVNGIVGQSDRDIVTIIESLRETIDNLNEFTRQIDEDPSLLIRGKKK
jgi:phospholipid/cholesterol/gamma-HCH transport system substrate-binding protein